MSKHDPCHKPSHHDYCFNGTYYHEFAELHDAFRNLWKEILKSIGIKK